VEGGYDAEIVAAAAERPVEIGMGGGGGDYDGAGGGDELAKWEIPPPRVRPETPTVFIYRVLALSSRSIWR